MLSGEDVKEGRVAEREASRAGRRAQKRHTAALWLPSLRDSLKRCPCVEPACRVQSIPGHGNRRVRSPRRLDMNRPPLPPPSDPFPTEPDSSITRRNEDVRASGESLYTVLGDARRFAERSARRHRSRLVLVADDDADQRELLALTLREVGFSVEEASDGAMAVAKARALSPDVIVMDYRMPTMSGGEAARVLASDDGTRSIPVLLLSAVPDVIPREERLGCAAFLAKPCSADELGHLLHLIIAAHSLKVNAEKPK
jgi:CheY-like chemotaxis protein